MTSEIVGPLTPTSYDPDFFYSQPFPIPYFDNKELKIGFTEPKHQPYLLHADKVLADFLKLNAADRINGSEMVHAYYSEILECGYTSALKINTVKDIWNFVWPLEIVVEWDTNGDYYLLVSCGCEWEEEHGLQLVF